MTARNMTNLLGLSPLEPIEQFQAVQQPNCAEWPSSAAQIHMSSDWSCIRHWCLSVCLSVSVHLIVAKRLIGSVCRSGGEWGRLRHLCMGSIFPRGRGSFGDFLVYWFEWCFWMYFKNKMRWTRAWKVYDISVRTVYAYQWRCLFFFLKSQFVTRWELAFTRNMLKCNSDFTNKSRIAATLTRG